MKNIKSFDEFINEKYEALNEGKQVGTIYYYVSIPELEDMLKTDKISNTNLNKINFYRNSDYEMPNEDSNRDPVVRVTFDGDTMSNNIKFKPEGRISNMPQSEDIDAIKLTDFGDSKEVVYKDQISNVKKHIKQVDILVPNNVKQDKDLKEMRDSIAKKLNTDANCNIVNRFVGYDFMQEHPDKGGIIDM